MIQRINQERRIMIGADLAPGVVERRADRSTQLPTMQNLPDGRRARALGPASGRRRADVRTSSIAVISGIFLVFAVLVLLYKRLMPPFVNMGSLLLAPLGGALALHITGHAALDAGADRHPDAARHRRQELDPADRLRDRGDGQGRAQGRGDHRCRPQARPADRDDHDGDGRRHGADRAVADGRRAAGARRWASS